VCVCVYLSGRFEQPDRRQRQWHGPTHHFSRAHLSLTLFDEVSSVSIARTCDLLRATSLFAPVWAWVSERDPIPTDTWCARTVHIINTHKHVRSLEKRDTCSSRDRHHKSPFLIFTSPMSNLRPMTMINTLSSLHMRVGENDRVCGCINE